MSKQIIKKFNFGEITVTFSPIKVLSLLMIIVSALYSLSIYRTDSICDSITGLIDEEKYGWIPVPEHSSQAIARYKHLDNGAFAYRHFYMDDFQKEFNVQPIHFPVSIHFYVFLFCLYLYLYVHNNFTIIYL
jgi:hypothetical protein